MAYSRGRCTNFDYCSLADQRRELQVRVGDAFTCPECGKPLKAPPGDAAPGGNQRVIVFAAIGAAVLGIGGYAAMTMLRSAPPAAPAAPAANEAPPAAPAAPPAPAPAPAPAAASAPPAAAPAAPPPPPEPEDVLLRLRGSNTIGSKLGPQLAAAYLAQNGDSDIRTVPGANAEETKVSGLHNGKREAIIIAAHGSATAFTGLAAGDTDIGMASRRVKPAEADALKALGDMTSPANEHVLALDGIAVIVNPANQVAALTKDQLRGIFAGTIKNWAELGGAPGAIDVYARDDKSGTFDTFKALVLDKTPLVTTAKRFEDSRELSGNVASDPQGIGFVGLPYVLNARAVAVAENGASPLVPNRLTIGTEDYALSRRLFLYTPTVAKNPAVTPFVTFALSEAGQKIAEGVGFVPLTIRTAEVTVPQTASDRYRALVASAQRLSTNFRFRSNSAVLDNRGLRDLDRVVDFIVAQKANPQKLILIGFADNRGGAEGNLAVSRKRADAVAQALAQRGIKVGQVAAFGAELPVADNASDDGREKNRRVEVFLTP